MPVSQCYYNKGIEHLINLVAKSVLCIGYYTLITLCSRKIRF